MQALAAMSLRIITVVNQVPLIAAQAIVFMQSIVKLASN